MCKAITERWLTGLITAVSHNEDISFAVAANERRPYLQRSADDISPAVAKYTQVRLRNN